MQCLLLSVCPASKLLDYTNIFVRSRRNENSRESVRCPLQLYLYLKQRLKQNNCWQGFGQDMICWAFRHKYCLQPNAIFFFRSNNSYLALTTIKKFNIYAPNWHFDSTQSFINVWTIIVIILLFKVVIIFNDD